MNRLAVIVGASVALPAALAAGGAAAPSRTAAAFADVPCPAQVRLHAIGTARCGYLRVPEDRRRPEGRTIRLFVVRERPAGDVPVDPVLAVWELGLARSWATSDALPTRLHREVITMDARGLGRSRPSLACPEVDRLAPVSLAARSSDARTRRLLLAAVRRCRVRLAGAAVEVAAYNLSEAAADAHDLRVALDIDRWNVGGYGSGARLALELLRRDGEHVRAVYLDSPEAAQVDLLTAAITSTRAAVDRLATACRADRSCHARRPRLARTLAATIARHERHPLRLRGAYRNRGVPVALDGATTLRALREAIALYPRHVPSAFAGSDRAFSAEPQHWISDRPAFTLGYAIDQGSTFVFGHGAYFSTVCRDQIAFVSQASLRRLTRSSPAYREAFAEGPLHAVCRVWRAGRGKAEVRTPVASRVPVLALVGRFDAYSSRLLAARATARLSRSWNVEIPNWGYNVMHEPCANAVRTAWVDAPASPPDTTCIRRLRPMRFVLR